MFMGRAINLSTPWASRLRRPGFHRKRPSLWSQPFGYQSLTLARSRVPETASYPHHSAKRLGVGRRFLLRAWITCSLLNRRHACGGTAHEAKAGCRRHGCAVATVPLIKAWRCMQRRFAGRIGSRLLCSPFRLYISCGATLAPIAGQPG